MKNSTTRFQGIIWGLLSGASFGLIPLFTLPIMQSGLTNDSVLFYRFAIAALMIGLFMLIKRESFRIIWSDALKLILLGVFYMGSALFLLWGYDYLASGLATAVHFLYPVCVVLIMAIFFGEKLTIVNIGAVLLAITGVTLVSGGAGDHGDGFNGFGTMLVVISALAYALYIVGLKKLRLKSVGGLKLTFYVLAITAIIFFLKAIIWGNGIQHLGTPSNFINISLLALIPTVLSNFALVMAVDRIGSTTTSILGAMEPLTAVFLGTFIFHEPLTITLVIGVILIIMAVIAIVAKKK